VRVSNSHTLEAEVGGGEFEANLGYTVKPCLKKKIKGLAVWLKSPCLVSARP
jgi:hypothetical protein